MTSRHTYSLILTKILSVNSNNSINGRTFNSLSDFCLFPLFSLLGWKHHYAYSHTKGKRMSSPKLPVFSLLKRHFFVKSPSTVLDILTNPFWNIKWSEVVSYLQPHEQGREKDPLHPSFQNSLICGGAFCVLKRICKFYDATPIKR